ncbi:MAG TPA: PAS domain-containing sensor histidine kinase [Gammaproteobacteria bacterium]|nr:PAS domain-containing sensor histidine kinase [Gammaproteobacteria bacterium]
MSILRKLIRRIPLSLFAAIVGVIAGLGLWEILDNLQKDEVNQIYQRQLQENLEQRSHESLIYFHNSIQGYKASAQLLASHRRLANYLDPLYWFSDDQEAVVVYHEKQPSWLPQPSRWKSLISPSHILLIDRMGVVRESYQAGDLALPEDISSRINDYLATDQTQAYLTIIDNKPWLLASTVAEDAAYNIMGTLMLVVPIDEDFLQAAQPGLSRKGVITALLESSDQRLLATSNSRMIPIGDEAAKMSEKYAVTSQTFLDSGETNQEMLFATFIPRDAMRAMALRIVRLEQHQRGIVALTFIAFFSLLFMVVSNRLSAALRRLSKFSQRALGISQPIRESGNQLMILEDWMKQFIRLVRDAREKMRVLHESEIRQKEALTTAIMEASLDSIVTVDQSGSIIDFNPTAEKTFGYQAADAKGKSVESLIIDAASQVHFSDVLKACFESGEEVRDLRLEMIACNNEGSRFPVEVAIKPILLDSSTLFTIYLHDISQRRKQEQEIRSLAAFPEESPIPVMRVNRKGVITYANAASEPLLEFLGVTRMQLIPLNWRSKIEYALNQNSDYESEVELGGRIYFLLIAPIAGLDYANLYARDITEMRAAEADARRHQTELVHVCRLSSMGEMATGLAHELNQPLAAIINYANGAKRRFVNGANGEELAEPLQRITSQAGRAARIIKRLREMVERQVPVRNSARLNNLVHEVLSFLDFETRKNNIQIKLDLAVDLPAVSIDLVQIEQVILNMTRNAVDALIEAGVSPGVIRISTSRRDAMLTVTVEDNGPGLSAEDEGRIFEPFFTTKQSGMGMGLSISETIVADHGGKISYAKSSLGGAAFTIWLPVTG